MYWITGAEGQLGSMLAKRCTSAVCSGGDVDIADMISLQKFAKKHPEITHIINAAAFSKVDAAEELRAEAYRANVIGPDNLMHLADEIGAKLTHISTDYVFAGDGKRPLTEEDMAGPCNYYGKTKLQGEKRMGPNALVIRTSWLFGGKSGNFIAQLLKLLMTQKEIHLANDQWSRFTYVPDLVEAILLMQNASGMYHFANAGVATKYDFGVALREAALALGMPVITQSIVPVPGAFFPAPCKRPTYSALDTTKIEKHLSIRHWQKTLKDFLCAQQLAYS